MTVLLNRTKRTVIAEKPELALRFFQRFRGMIGRHFDFFDAMIFPDCYAVHTFFMSIPLDVIFFDRDGRVLKCVKSLKPWIPVCSCHGASGVIELPCGSIDKSHTEPGDQTNLCCHPQLVLEP